MNKYKYIAISLESGYQHLHCGMSPIYASLYGELLNNTIYPITYQSFCQQLSNARETHRAYQDEYQCRHYKKKYNISRNTRIGMHHILSLTI